MKGNFVYYNPTRLYFGNEAHRHLEDALKDYGKKVLLIYGGGSIKRNGIYDDVIAALKAAGKEVVELSGVMPNPTYSKLEEGRNVARKNNVDFILAVGGGSTIDYSKGVAATTWYDGDAWQHFYIEQHEPAVDQKVIPVGAVLTMAGTGSEMNGGSVITNTEQKLKIGKVFGSRLMPKFAILNPEYTFSLPKEQMVAGIFDIMSHILEQYFSGDDESVSDYIAEGLMRSLIQASRVAIKDPRNYEARSNIMWTATWALNTLIGKGKSQDWMVHMIGQAIGAYTDSTHGMTLAAVSPAYYRYIMADGLHKFVRFAREVWGISVDGKDDASVAAEGINALEEWIKEIGAASNSSMLGVTEDMIEGITGATFLGGGYRKMTAEDVRNVLRASL